MSNVKQLVIDGTKARKLFPTASKEWKEVLTETFGAAHFSQDICERINSIDDVFAELGLDKDQWYEERKRMADHKLAMDEAELIAECLNEGKKIAPGDYRYYPYFYLSNTAGGFRFYASFCGFVYSAVGSRPCLVSENLSNHAGRTFSSIYKRFID